MRKGRMTMTKNKQDELEDGEIIKVSGGYKIVGMGTNPLPTLEEAERRKREMMRVSRGRPFPTGPVLAGLFVETITFFMINIVTNWKLFPLFLFGALAVAAFFLSVIAVIYASKK
jgi:hypothetical protein